MRVLSAGQSVRAKPNATDKLPDVTIDSTGEVGGAIEARYVPIGTVVRLYLVSEDAPDQDSDPRTP